MGAHRRHRPTVVIAGGGAAGSLVALHLVRTANRRSCGLEVVIVDPADRWGRGVAFGTAHGHHLLNVPASGMSALPEDPGHFVAWRHRDEQEPTHPSTSQPDGPEPASPAYTFAPRRQFGRYLDETLTEAVRSSLGEATVRHVRKEAVAINRTPSGAALVTADGTEVGGDAVVVATGLPAAGHGWAPDSLYDSAFFVPDPWAPGALDVVRRSGSGPADVLLVGTGLTMVDVALTLSGPRNRPDRVLHAISRRGRLPAAHAPEPQLAAIPDVSDWGHGLDEVRNQVSRHLAEVRETTGDWRPAMDGLRFRISSLWVRLREEEREEFLATDAGAWNVMRHRIPPPSAAHLDVLRADGRLRLETGQVTSVEPLPTGGLHVGIRDEGQERFVDVDGW